MMKVAIKRLEKLDSNTLSHPNRQIPNSHSFPFYSNCDSEDSGEAGLTQRTSISQAERRVIEIVPAPVKLEVDVKA
jgi:hypothetical protein